MGRPETDDLRGCAMGALGNGLSAAGDNEEALSVKEAELAMVRRLGVCERTMLGTQSNLAGAYANIRRYEEALPLLRTVYSGYVKLLGEDHANTLIAVLNYARCLLDLQRFEEAKTLMRKTMPMAQRLLVDSHDLMLRMRRTYANALFYPAATLDDLREAVNTLEELERTARRVLGDVHPITEGMEDELQDAQDALYARGLP